MLGGSGVIAAEVEEIVDLMRLSSRFELLHLPLSSARRLMRVFGSVVQSLVLPMLNTGHHLPFGRPIAGPFVGDHDAGRPQLLFQELAQ